MKALAAVFVCFVTLATESASTAANAPAPVAPTDLATVEKTLIARWDAVRSLTGAVSGSASIAACFPKVPLQGTVSANGPLVFLRKDGRELARIDLAADLAEGARIGRITALMNATHAFFQAELLGNTQIEEAKPPTPENGGAAPGGRSLFQALHAHLKLTAKGRQTLAGKEVYVIEGHPKDAAGAAPLAAVRLCFDPDTGLVTRAIGFDAQGAVLAALNVSNIRANEPVAVDQFAGAPTTAPSGVAAPDLAEMAESARSGLENLTNQVKEKLAR